jgi:hypothetical protein
MDCFIMAVAAGGMGSDQDRCAGGVLNVSRAETTTYAITATDGQDRTVSDHVNNGLPASPVTITAQPQAIAQG